MNCSVNPGMIQKMKTYNSFFYCCLLSMSVMAADTALWIAPSEDIVGTGTVAVPNGIKDWHIRIDSPALSGTEPAAWRIRGGMWYSMADRGQWRLPYDKGFGHWESLVAVRQSGQRADIYIEPLLAWPGDVFDVEAVLSTKKVLRWKLLSNAEGWLPGGEWLGQGPSDYIGSAKAERDGIREWELGITSPFLEGTPARVDVWLPYRPVGSRIARSGC